MNKLGFIDIFSNKELEIVKRDILEHYDGIKSIYVVDTYDIIHYTLPFIIKNIFNNKKSNYTYSTIFYENIFSKPERFPLVLPNEYTEEISNITENFNYKISKFPEIRDRLLHSISKVIDSNDLKKAEKLFYDDFELIIVLSIFYDKGINLFSRFNDFISSNLNIDSFNSDNQALNEYVMEIFSKTKKGNLTNNLFDYFIQENKLKLASLTNDYERYCYLDNTYRDISVIDRISSINKKKTQKNFRVKYLSSPPTKTQQLFEYLEVFEKTNNEFNRNINQLFLLNHILENSTNKNEAIDSIDFIVQIKSMQVDISNQTIHLDDSFNPIINSVFKSFLSIKKEIETSYLFDSYFQYKDSFSSYFKENYSSNKKELSSLINSLSRIDTSVLKKIELNNSVNPKLKLSQVHSLSKKFNELSAAASSSININLGEDIIKNTFHHLPYSLFCYMETNETISKYYNLINTISSYSHLVGLKSIEFRDELSILLNSLSRKKITFKSKIIDFLILTFINLITESEASLQDENEIINIVLEQKEILDKSSISLSHNTDEKKISVKFNKKKIHKEFDYLLLWLYRRTLQFEKCFNIIDNNQKYLTDPRFIHGKGLAFHSHGYHFIDSNNKENAIKSFLMSKETLMQSYELFENSVFIDKSLRNIVLKQKIGILNTIIDSNNRLAQLEGIVDEQRTFESRTLLNLIKKLTNKILPPIEYSSLETVNHTESELEYYEAKLYFDNSDYIESLLKLNHTVERLNVVNKSKTLVGERFKKIEDKINKLRLKNFIALEIV